MTNWKRAKTNTGRKRRAGGRSVAAPFEDYAMLCLEDCIGFSDLDQDEVAAIAEHEHVPVIVAAEIGCELLKSSEGVAKLHAMVLDDIETALEHGRKDHASELAMTYRQLQNAHPL